MYRGAKYVIVLSDGEELPVIIPGLMKHVDVRIRKPIRAGFVSITIKDEKISVHCWGKSESLGLESDSTKDEELIYSLIIKGTVYG